MTPHTITALSLLVCGLVLLIVGALIGNDTLLTVGTTVMVTGVAYATGKAVANRTDPKDPT